jgi:hypothetical protein
MSFLFAKRDYAPGAGNMTLRLGASKPAYYNRSASLRQFCHRIPRECHWLIP